jgi:hypothetical protein
VNIALKNRTQAELGQSSTMIVARLRHPVRRLAMIGAGIDRN